jgi:Tol biopolymer transport system component
VSTDTTPGWVFFDSDRARSDRDLYRIRPNGTELTQLTTEASIEKEPAVSPDGTRITFTSDRDGTMQIYLMELATQKVVKLTDLAAGADQSSFSRDGTMVAFHSGSSVYVTRLDGAGSTLVATGINPFNAYFWPKFTPDDQELVFDRNNQIHAVRLDGTGLRAVVNNWTIQIKAPSVSPAAGELAYHAHCGLGGSGEPFSIWTTRLSTSMDPCSGRRITPPGEPASQQPAWGPNNVFAYERVAATNVASIALKEPGSPPCILTPDSADNRHPAWSR